MIKTSIFKRESLLKGTNLREVCLRREVEEDAEIDIS
jgi:hypothetical protein